MSSELPVYAPSIGHDILLDIMKCLADQGEEGRDAIAAMSRTCRSLRIEGVRRLLSSTVRVNIEDEPHLIAAFCHFMRGDPAFRLPLLRGLSVSVSDLQEDVARPFADVLTQAPHLEHLNLEHLVEVTIPVAIIICSALTSLTSLKHLALGGGPGTWGDPSYDRLLHDAFRNMRSPLTSIYVYMPSMRMPHRNILYIRRRDPIFLLSKFTGTLGSLRIAGRIRVGGGIHVYPLVEELQVPNYLSGMPDLKTYLLSFPNTQRLRCGFENDSWIRYRHNAQLLEEKCFLATIQEWHDLNKRNWTGHPHAWSMLQSFRGSIIDAYVLSLPCRVAHMHLLSTGGQQSVEYAILSTILFQTQPSSLRLCLKVYDGRGYIPILPPSSLWAGYLTTLEIRINIVKHVFDLKDCFAHISDMLRPMSVSSFKLELRCANVNLVMAEELQSPSEARSEVKCEEPFKRDDALCYVRNMVLQENLHERVRDILSAAPTIRKVTLMWGRCYVFVPDWVVGIDLDNMPYSTDRPGDDSDGWDMRDWDW